jgi:hypothetical protein
VKRVIGSPLGARSRTPRGVEEWIEDGRGGGILTRRIDARFLVRALANRGLVLVERFATELFDFDAPALRLLNRWYVELGGPPSLALENLFVFEKRDHFQSVSQSKASSTSILSLS